MAVTNPTLALGLSSVSDFGTSIIFLDQVKRGRIWVDSSFARITEDIFDVDGWPTSMAAGGLLKAYWTTLGLAGTYVVTWDGNPTLAITGSGVSGTVTTTGRKEFSYSGGSFNVNVTAVGSPSITNLRVFRKDREALLALGAIFEPDWLTTVQDTRQVRFMDWMDTNDSTLAAWADRPTGKPTNNYGTAIEVMVALANTINADPWFCFPQEATDEYVEEFATYIEANLNPGLVAYYEYSNEIWNTSFTANAYCVTQGGLVGWTTGAAAVKGNQWSGYRAAQIMEIVRTVYGVDSGTTWKGVPPGRPGSGVEPGATQTQRWEGAQYYLDNEAPPATAMSDLFSVYATTSYFGSGLYGDNAKWNEMLTYLAANGTAATNIWLYDQLSTVGGVSDSVPNLASGRWAEDKDNADLYGLELVAYEGGQHVHHGAYTGVDPSTTIQDTIIVPFMTQFMNSQYMADLYEMLWAAWEAISDGPFMQFVDYSAPGRFGVWGMLQALNETNPRTTYMLAKNAEQDSWFGDGGGTRYIAKTIKALAAGENVTVSVKGGIVSGSTGKERVNVAGARADYSLSQAGGVCTLSKSGFELETSGVEIISYTG